MKKTAAMSIKSVYGSIDPNKLDNSFEVKYYVKQIFGLDYMLDEDFKVYLIEVNTNPCFEQSSTLLSRLIPQMIDNALRYMFKILELQLILYFHHQIFRNGQLVEKRIYLKILQNKISLSLYLMNLLKENKFQTKN